MAVRCVFDHNAASGVECVDGSVSLEDCVVHSNLAGVGINGELSQYTLKRCNIFANRLNGIEVMDTVAAPLISQCEVRNNLRGVILWRTSGTVDVAALQNGLIAANSLQGNRSADALVKVRDAGQTLVEAAEADGVCTFTYTGPHFYPHIQRGCYTCGLDGNSVLQCVSTVVHARSPLRVCVSRCSRLLPCVRRRVPCGPRLGAAYGRRGLLL